MTVLSCQQLQLNVPGKTLVSGLDWDIEAGQFWLVIGRNGSGKTTLLQTLAGLRPAAGGEISLHSQPLQQYRRRQIAQRMAILFQHQESGFPITVQESALAGRHPHRGLWDWSDQDQHETVFSALQTMDLASVMQLPVDQLSGGERRRLELATLLIQDPELYLLDEPTNHLDLHHQISTLEHFSGLAAAPQHCVVMASHELNLGLRYCSHVLLLYGNGAWEAGRIDEVIDPERLERLYQHPMTVQPGSHGNIYLPA